MSQNPPLRSVDDLPSYKYWRESDARIKQFWYVSFCLLMSSVQDRLTGLALRESRNLNWSATAFYYSTIHAARLVCFVVSGDYPKRHEQLARLFSPAGSSSPNAISLDWWASFMSEMGGAAGTPRDSERRSSIDAAVLRDGIQACISKLSGGIGSLVPLAKLKNLRNDCNYEALLVAHEVEHDTVTAGFEELADSADHALGLAVDLACAVYLAHLQLDRAFETSRSKIHAAHARYLADRLEESLLRKFSPSPSAMTELARVLKALEWRGAQPTAPDELDRFLRPIMRDTFDEKNVLMKKWKEDITALRKSLLPSS